jgi:hypothetical protein
MRAHSTVIIAIAISMLSSGQAFGANDSFCEFDSRFSDAPDLRGILQDPHIAEMLFIKEEMLSIIASADRSELLKHLRAGDLESAARIAGVSGEGSYPYREKLLALSAIVLERYPELVQFMPRAPFVDSAELAAIMLERFPASDGSVGDLIIPFSQILPELQSSFVEKKGLGSSSLLWDGGLTPPPSGPFDRCRLGAWDPDCAPESPDGPLPENPDMPDDGPPWGPEGSCQEGPFAAGLVVCAALPKPLIPFCLYQNMCSSCEGEIFDTLCFGG